MSLDKLSQIIEKGLLERKVFEDAKGVVDELRGLKQNADEIRKEIKSLHSEQEEAQRKTDAAIATAAIAENKANDITGDALRNAESIVRKANESAEGIKAKALAVVDGLAKERATIRHEIDKLKIERDEAAKALQVVEASLSEVRAKFRAI